jgi:hypothetical protein
VAEAEWRWQGGNVVGRAGAGETPTLFGDGNLEKWQEVAACRCPIRMILLAPNLETEESGFFVLWTFLKKLRNEPSRNLFPCFGSFESRQSGWRDS